MHTGLAVALPGVDTYVPAAHCVQATHVGDWKPVADHVPAAQGCAVTHVLFEAAQV